MTPAQLQVLGDTLREAGLDEFTIGRMLAASNPRWLGDYCLRVAINVRQHCERLAAMSHGASPASMAIGNLNLAPIVDAAIHEYTSHGYSIGSYVEKHKDIFERVAFAHGDEDGVDGSGRIF